jgi:arginyl-tRNA synthetase
VKADDLINQLQSGALKEVEKRNSELPDEEKKAAAHEIAVAALRYFLLKFTRNSVIAFDFQEALSFEGETGPYCQYAAVRINSIFRKLGDDLVQRAEQRLDVAASDSSIEDRISAVLSGEGGTEIWSLVMLAERLSEVIQQCKISADPRTLRSTHSRLRRRSAAFISDSHPSGRG